MNWMSCRRILPFVFAGLVVDHPDLALVLNIPVLARRGCLLYSPAEKGWVPIRVLISGRSAADD